MKKLSLISALLVLMTLLNACGDDGKGGADAGGDAGGDASAGATCGDGVLDPGETCDPADTCPSGCDDSLSCTQDHLVGSPERCDARCEYVLITACADDDGCCPTGCTPAGDNDCSADCGDGEIGPGETCDGACATACEALDACAPAIPGGSAATCDAVCRSSVVEACVDGDGCCAPGCNNDNDDDCIGGCDGGGPDLSINIETRRVSGDLTQVWAGFGTLTALRNDGETLSLGSGLEGARVVLIDRASGDRVALGESGSGAFDVPVAEGTYDLALEHTGNASESGLLILESGISVDASTEELDMFAFESQLLSGSITVGGESVNGNTQSFVVLERVPGGDAISLGPTNEDSYSVIVPEGVYDITYVSENRDGVTPENPHIVLQSSVQFGPGGTLDINVPSASINGNLTISGESLSLDGYNDFELRLRPENGGSEVLIELQGNDATYKTIVVPGVYDLIYESTSVSSSVPLAPPTVIMEDVHITNDGTLHIDIPSVDIAGDFTVNGEPTPKTVYDDGFILLRRAGGDETILIGRTREQAYFASVVPGTYDLIYRSDDRGIRMPHNTEVVLENAVDVSGGTLDIDIPAVEITGDFRLNGHPFPGSPFDRAIISVLDRNTGSLTPIGKTNEPGYWTVLVPGEYDLVYSADNVSVVIPINTSTVIAGDVSFAVDADYTIEVTSHSLDGAITLNGGPFPTSAYDYGLIRLNPVDGQSRTLARTNKGQFAVNVLPGQYYIGYRYVTGGNVPQGVIPNITGVFTVDGDTTKDVDVASQGIGGSFLADGLPFANAGAANNAAYSLVDLASGDRFDLGQGSERSFETLVVPGRYEYRYSYAGGEDVPRNEDARLGCVDVIIPQ